MIIAIDGPGASGKSTVAKAVASRLGMHYLDTGAMYRAVAALALERGLPLDDEAALTELAEQSPVTFSYEPGATLPSAVFIDGWDVTRIIRTPEVDASVSAVARVPGVREVLVTQQRALAGGDAVVEGRDIGTVVFPNAEVKVFLTASPQERARRRSLDMVDLGHDLTENEVLERLERRDHLDSTRQASPLECAPDAIMLDTTGRTAEEVVDELVARAAALR